MDDICDEMDDSMSKIELNYNNEYVWKVNSMKCINVNINKSVNGSQNECVNMGIKDDIIENDCINISIDSISEINHINEIIEKNINIK